MLEILSMSFSTDRRRFLQSTAAAGRGLLGRRRCRSGREQIAQRANPSRLHRRRRQGPQRRARTLSKFGKIFALCDVDRTFLDGSRKPTRREHNFTDFREMLDKLGDQIDAVTVSTPDHTHAVIAAKAMKMGKHVLLPEAADALDLGSPPAGRDRQEKGVATQMGNQYTALRADAQGRLPDSRRPARHGEGSSRLDQSPDLAAGRSTAPPRSRCRRSSTGKRGSARRRCGPTPTAITPSSGAAGGTSAPAPWATWPATRATCRSWPSTCATPTAVEAECPEHDGDSYPAGRRSSSTSRSSTAAPRSPCTGTTAATCRRASCSRT